METEAQKRAHQKYESTKIERITFRVPRGNKAKILKCASKNKESINQFLNRLVNKEINHYK